MVSRWHDVAVGLAAGVCGLLVASCGPGPGPAAAGDHAPPPSASAVPFDLGDPESALRGLPKLWADGGDPSVIDGTRTQALDALAAAGRYTVGADAYELRDVRAVYEWMLAKPDVLHSRVTVAGELPADRLLVLAVVAGSAHAAPAREGAAYVLPEIDLEAALASPDPWLVSAALFMARKQDISLELGDLLTRWQDGGPWDTTCTEQALLYLAQWSRADLERAAAGSLLPAAAADLAAPDPAAVELEPWLFLSSGEWSPDLVVLERGAGLSLELRDSTMDVIGVRPLAAPDRVVALPATDNYYSLRYLDGAMHGESRFVEGAAGSYVRLATAVLGGV